MGSLRSQLVQLPLQLQLLLPGCPALSLAARTLPSYVLPLVVRMTSGARYAGVPTLDPGAD